MSEKHMVNSCARIKISFVKRITVMILLVSMIFGGCTPASSDKEGAGDVVVSNDTVKVGFSQLGAESDWRRANTDSILGELTKEAGYTLYYEDAQQKQANQAMAIRRFIQQGMDYIVVAPVTEVGWDNVLLEAKQAGIPVILIDRMVDVKDMSLYSCWIGSDFRLEADKLCSWMQQLFEKKSLEPEDIHIAHLQGTEGASAQIGRTGGIDAAIRRNGWDLVAREGGDFTQVKGREVTERMLRTYPDINVIYSENDNMALGALEAIEGAGRKPGSDIANGEIMVVSFDGVSEEAMKKLSSGEISCIAECYPMHGPYVKSAIEMFETGSLPGKKSYVTEGIYSAESSITQVYVGSKDYPVTIMRKQ